MDKKQYKLMEYTLNEGPEEIIHFKNNTCIAAAPNLSSQASQSPPVLPLLSPPRELP